MRRILSTLFAGKSLCLALVAIQILAIHPQIWAQESSAGADALEAGDLLPEFTVETQHGKSFSFPSESREVELVLVSFDMSTGKKANGALAELGKDFLPEQKAVFMANIYGMPGIGRFFAFRKMKRYPHEILYADKEGFLDNFPQKEGWVTIFKVNPESREIETIQMWNPEKTTLTDALKEIKAAE